MNKLIEWTIVVFLYGKSLEWIINSNTILGWGYLITAFLLTIKFIRRDLE